MSIQVGAEAIINPVDGNIKGNELRSYNHLPGASGAVTPSIPAFKPPSRSTFYFAPGSYI
jgi:hypothetical protein